jgi:DNA repair exonuclease SbcCD ATPase subunit
VTDEKKEEIKDARLTSEVTRALLNALDLGLYGSPWDESDEDAPILNDDEAKVLRGMIAELVKRIGKDNFEAAIVAAGLQTHRDEFNAQVTEAERLEDSLGDKNSQLNALRKELRASYGDMENMQDQLTDMHERLKSQKLKRATALHELNGTLTDEVKESLTKITDEALDSKLDLLSGQVDIGKIADKVNDGLSRTPVESIDNPVPTATEPSVVEDKTETKKPTYQSQAWVDGKFRQYLVIEKNPDKANAFYKDSIAQGLAAPRPGDLE